MIRLVRPAAIAAAILFTASLTLAQDNKLKVKVGDAFPSVPLEASSIDKAKAGAKTISIDDFKGRNVVIFFYPKALTKGCTIESCGFRDIIKEFPSDAVVLGASADDVPLQTKFTETHMLPYALLADTDLKLIKSLGILSASGKTPTRVTFVVGKDGKIAKIYDKVTPASHPKEVLAFVKSLK